MAPLVTHRISLLLCILGWCFLGWLVAFPCVASAQVGTQDSSPSAVLGSSNSTASFEELLEESRLLLGTGRPIDARAKLQQALAMRPEDYRPHMLLGQYYLFNVAHFKLAYRYLKTAEKHFSKTYGSDLDGSLSTQIGGEHAILLYLLSEAELNLDRYQASLDTLDRFEKLYWLDWYPGTRAWVLMKLKRIDEAITVAQAGLARKADPRRTWNILGILLSVKGSRELSLNAFQQAIKTELSLLGSGMIATPLNNAGEVYREMFKDAYAEGSWLRAVRLPDGCEHVLPSLNLANLYIDQTRLFQAERVLKDFETCFAADPLRKDTEHRTLLALARGKIALHSNNLDSALELIRQAAEEEQWFGKIGTNQNDVTFAANVAFAQALNAQAVALEDRAYESFVEKAQAKLQIPFLRLRAWWLNRQARRIALEELDDFEDLFIRNTDSMVAYPTLGSALAGFSTRSLRKRVERMISTDDRKEAHNFYRLYLAKNLLAHGENEEAKKILSELLTSFSPHQRLARAEVLANLLVLQKDESSSWFHTNSAAEEKTRIARSYELFELLPSHLRFYNLPLPVLAEARALDEEGRSILTDISNSLLSARFEQRKGNSEVRYSLAINAAAKNADGSYPVSLHLIDTRSKTQILVESENVSADGTGSASLINSFINKVFAHRRDPLNNEQPSVPILKGIL